MKYLNKTSKTSRKKRLFMFIGGFVKIADAIIPILTLGFYWTEFQYRYSKWHMIYKANNHQNTI